MIKRQIVIRLIEKNKYMKSKITKLFIHQLKDTSLNFDQFTLLTMIDKQCLLQREIALELQITEATLSVRINRLEKQGFIKKVPSQKDKRKFNLTITDYAREELKKAEKIIDQLIEQIYKDISEEEINTVLSFLMKLEDNLEELE